jgi:hypothetical protein
MCAQCIVLDPLRFCSNLQYIDRHGRLEIETTRAETRWCPHCVYNRSWREGQPAPSLGNTAEEFQCARTLDDCGSVRRSWAH